jgi:hypothetical protein
MWLMICVQQTMKTKSESSAMATLRCRTAHQHRCRVLQSGAVLAAEDMIPQHDIEQEM